MQLLPDGRTLFKVLHQTGKLKKLPNTWKQHIAGAHEPEDMYYDEDGNV